MRTEWDPSVRVCFEPENCPPEEVAAWIFALLYTEHALQHPRHQNAGQHFLETASLETPSVMLGFLSANHMFGYLVEAPQAVMARALAMLASQDGALHRLASRTLTYPLLWPAQFEAGQIQVIQRQFPVYLEGIDHLLGNSLYPGELVEMLRL